MREILFRGKVARDCVGVSTQRKYKKGAWVFGDLSHTNYDPPLIDQNNDDPVPVDSSTVGQFTGLTDKNGKRIFEGDVVYDGFTKDKVVFEDCQWKLVDRHGMWINLFNREVEVIGNIHDNPELLEGGTDNG